MRKQEITLGRAIQLTPTDFPAEFFKAMSKWKMIIKSPYGNSFYSSEVDWGYKKHNSLRISDHWNFESNFKMHCETTTECPNNTHRTIAKFDNEQKKYIVIHSIAKKGYNNRKSFHYHMFKFIEKYDKIIEGVKLSNPKALKTCELSLLNKYYGILEQYS